MKVICYLDEVTTSKLAGCCCYWRLVGDDVMEVKEMSTSRFLYSQFVLFSIFASSADTKQSFLLHAINKRSARSE